MAQMTDMMVDLETTDTSPRGAIIQIAAIKFNFDTEEVGGVFDRCPMPLPMRGWSDGTREFWLGKNRKVYEQIVARAEPAEQVYRDFIDFARHGAPEGGYRFWSKPLSFDWPFLADHYDQLGLPMPFHYRYARDMNSYMAALMGSPAHPNVEGLIEFKGDLHNALHDTAFQLDMLFHVKKRYVHTEVIS